MIIRPIKLYSRISDRETVLELWGSSTKHPDSRFFFSKFDKTPYFSETSQVFQWVLECASKCVWEIHARDLVCFILKAPRID